MGRPSQRLQPVALLSPLLDFSFTGGWGGSRVVGMKQILLMIVAVVMVGCNSVGQGGGGTPMTVPWMGNPAIAPSPAGPLYIVP